MDEPRDPVRAELRELFFRAKEIPADQRERFFEGLRVEAAQIEALRALLRSHEEAGSFLESAIALPPNASSLDPGARLGPYEIVDLIGRGGMGVVYRARDTRLGRHVAVKVLPPEFVRDPGRRKRFEDEARAASALNHPNVLTIYDIGTVDGIGSPAFLVMELLEGETLRARLSRQPALARAEAIELATQIARGLAAAHAAGIVHRDIKPENLFVTADGRIKILDFGVAKLTGSADLTRTATDTGVVIGTVGYLAPEQARGQAIDARADIFSFGAVLFEMVAGKRAFARDSAADTLSAILHADPLQEFRGRNLGGVFNVIGRCLEKGPADRYQSALDVATALDALDLQSASRGWWHSTRIATALLTVTIAAVIGWQVTSLRGPGSSADSAEVDRIFAVLPFESIAADQSQAYFASGVTEELTAQLARVSSLRVMSRAAVAAYSREPNPAERIREELGVDTLLTGSVRFAGERARISVQLVNTENNHTIWAEQYDQRLTDVLQVQAAVATQILTALDARLSADERQRVGQRATENASAYDLYLKATSGTARAQGVALLKDAVRIDPKFAAAHAALSRLEGQLGDFGDRQFYADSLASARRALEADPTEARGHHALGVIQLRMGRLGEARLAFLRAMELSPNLAVAAFDLSVTDATLGHFDESLYWARRGFALAPNIGIAYYHVAIPLFVLADVEAVDRWFTIAEQRFPNLARIQYMWSESDFLAGRLTASDARIKKALAAYPDNDEVAAVGAQLAFLRGAPDAFARVEAIFKESPDARAYLLPESFRTMYAYLLMQRGERARSAALLKEAMQAARKSLEQGDQAPEVSMEIAAIHAYRGERQDSLKSLNAAYRAGSRLFRELDRDPFFDSIRNDAEFRRVRMQMEADVSVMRQRADIDALPTPVPVRVAALPK